MAVRGTAAAVRTLSDRHEKAKTLGRPLLAGGSVAHKPPHVGRWAKLKSQSQINVCVVSGRSYQDDVSHLVGFNQLNKLTVQETREMPGEQYPQSTCCVSPRDPSSAIGVHEAGVASVSTSAEIQNVKFG